MGTQKSRDGKGGTRIQVTVAAGAALCESRRPSPTGGGGISTVPPREKKETDSWVSLGSRLTTAAG